jgi:proline racemase
VPLSTIATTDYHTGGEPFRIVSDSPVPIPGETVAERRARAIEDAEAQGLRAVLCSESRGHIPQVTGMAYRTGEHVFSIDPHDPLVPGFVLR